MVNVKVEFQKTIVLQFSLPGYKECGANRTGRWQPDTKWQLERNQESWRIEIDAESAVATRDVFLALAAQIDLAISQGLETR